MTFKTFNALWKNLIFMARNGAPWEAIVRHVQSARVEDVISGSAQETVSDYKEKTGNLRFSQDWFSGNIPHWVRAFHMAGMDSDNSLKILEVGSFEGRSAFFFLNYFRSASIHCVDTWDGSDEHDGLPEINGLLRRFEENTSSVKNRLAKHVMTSEEFFISSSDRDFDIVYIDGSHRASDVLSDATSSFSRLRSGGLLMFDDYLWKHYDQTQKNPCSAINTFIKIFDGQFEWVRVGYQVYLKKI